MCGIAGILATDGAPVNPDHLAAMIGVLRHRGPDDAGLQADGAIGLAHARLSIIDLEGGAQPMCNEDRSVWIIFNGEIFNYLELREQLIKAGHAFATRSDTEVILHLYEQHGDAFVQYLNGQFAVALWDRMGQQLVLARDRVGIRPLFYTIAANRFLFASEIKSLFAVPGVTRQLNFQSLAEVFTFWSPLAPSTLFENVLSLPPGHMLTLKADGTQKLRRYWDWEFPVGFANGSYCTDEYVEELRTLLIDAVRLQLRADVPVGAYLSGGLDSSVIAALIKRYTNVPLRTFSIRFEDAEFDEGRYQNEVVRHLGTQHSEFRCSRRDIRRTFPSTIWHAESVVLRTAPTPLQLLSGHVREAGYKVVLTGEGADEVFGGYDLFREAMVRRFCARRPESKIRPKLLGRLYPYLRNSPTTANMYAESFFRQGAEQFDAPYFGHLPRWITTRRSWRFFSTETAEALRGWDPLKEIEAALPTGMLAWAPLCRDQYIEAHTLLSGYLLCSQGDRMAMANSVEARFPYLDHRVIEFANRLPVRYKIMGLQEKYILKRIAKDLLPQPIAARAKQPYRAPDSQSFFSNGKPADYVAELLSEPRLHAAGYFDSKSTAKLVEKCRRGDAIGFADNMAFVGILSTMLLDDMFIHRSQPSYQTLR
jgi:asparagine synthase (glutamine-hydrolysing)